MRTKNKKPEKKGAIELSIGTVVIIVLAMTMLVLGIVLVRNIFKGAIEIANVSNDKVRSQLANLFSEDDSTGIVINVAVDRRVRVEAGGDRGFVNFGFRPKTGRLESRTDYKYEIRADESQTESCVKQTSLKEVNEFFQYNFGDKVEFDILDDDSFLLSSIEIQVPEGTPSCTQKIFIELVNSARTNEPPQSNFFIIEVTQGGIFS